MGSYGTRRRSKSTGADTNDAQNEVSYQNISPHLAASPHNSTSIQASHHQMSCISAPPAPPPCPNFFSQRVTPDYYNDLLEELKSGKKLRSVSADSRKPKTNLNIREDVMAQIRQGTPLKHVDQRVRMRSSPNLTEMNGIAGALARALDERRSSMQYDHSSDEDENDEDEWSD